MPRTSQRPQHVAGFTLVELLVVISIIALIIAILLPSLQKARDAARNIVCLSNIRQSSVSVLVYGHDWQDKTPVHYATDIDGTPLFQYTKRPGNLAANTNQGQGNMNLGRAFPDYNSGESFYCPTDQNRNFENKAVIANFGFAHYELTPAVFPVSYLYPAVLDRYTRSNYGNNWTGIAPNYWGTFNGVFFNSVWGPSMAPERQSDAADQTMPMLWDQNGLHDYELANVAFFDGAGLSFPYHREMYFDLYSAPNYSRGMYNPQVVPTLRKFRTQHWSP